MENVGDIEIHAKISGVNLQIYLLLYRKVQEQESKMGRRGVSSGDEN